MARFPLAERLLLDSPAPSKISRSDEEVAA
jgi:hypothetical protein